MNTKDEALRLALEALEFDGFTPEDATHRSYHAKAITAIKQALKQPEPEPVAWMNKHGACKTNLFREVEAGAKDEYTIPLYTHPPKRKPLTDEQIEALRRSDDLFEDAPMWKLIARAIEAAHGIKGDA